MAATVRKKQPNEGAPDISILSDNVQIYPSGYTESPDARKKEDHERALIDTMARFRSSPFEFFREVSLHVNGTGWRAYDKIIGAPVYFPGFNEMMKEKVLSSPLLRKKVDELAQKRLEVERKQGFFGGNGGPEAQRLAELQEQLDGVVDNMLEKMMCKMESKSFIRSAYYLVTQLLTRAYHQGIHVSSEEILRLREVAEAASKKKQSIIFLPSHRSHVDYVSMQILSFRLGLALPTVVAGDNLNFPLVGPFLQNAGAMWIRRSFGSDQLYGTTVQAYIDTLLANGYNFECFIEGGRSRTGKLLPPKFGILGFVLDSVLSGRVNDVIICPISTQYDKVIEVDSYITELLGTPKKKEDLSGFLSASSILNLKLGRVDVRFHEPWSLRQFIDSQITRFTDIPKSLDVKDPQAMWTRDRRVRLLRTLGYRVLSDINDVSVVMPTALIGTVILTLRGRGVGKAELIRRVEWLCERVKDKGGRVAHFADQPTELVIERGLEVLGPALVGTVSNLPEDTYYAVDRFQLSFYRNMTIHLFILEALTCASLYTKVKQGGGPENQFMTYAEFQKEVSFLSQLFRGEFIFPTEGLEINMQKALRGLAADNVLSLTFDESNKNKIERISLADAEREHGRENFDFYCFLIWPFIEASWLGAVSLLMLTPPVGYTGDRWLESKVCHDRAQLLGKTLYHQGDLSYFEAVNKETLQNAYRRFDEEGKIETRKAQDGRPAQLRLAESWLPQRDPATNMLIPSGKLWAFAESISQSRREGKNRRDGKTVEKRVFGLVEIVGRQLWEEPVAGVKKVGDGKKQQKKKKAKL